MFHFIQQQNELDYILKKMDQCSCYGIDTEFIKVDTFWPKLGLCQVNIDNEVYLLDGTSLDFTQVWERFFRAKQTIFHACSEDIDLIYHYSSHKRLDNVFDTQVGLSFLGEGLQVSYQTALKLCLGIEIEKDQTRSDWLARPLSQQQLNYAANDVLYLKQLAQHVMEKLQKKQMYEWVLEDCRSLTQEIVSELPLSELYTDVGNYRHTQKQLMQLQQLSVWREQMIKAMNQPRSFVLRNATMIDLVEKNPKNLFQLSQVKDIRPNIVREYGKTILDIIHYLPSEDEWPLRIARPIRSVSKELSPHVNDLIDKVIAMTEVPKEVLLRKKWLNALYRHVVADGDEQDLPSYLLGWRYQLLTQPLIALLQQDKDYLATQMKVMD